MDEYATPCSGGDCIRVRRYEDGSVDLLSTRRPGVVTADADEWAAFLADAKAGRYDP